MFITIDGEKIYCHVAGEGKPVVLLHGFGCDHRLMAGCMEPVFQTHPGYRRIYVDLPGMGKSSGPLSWASSGRILEVLAALIPKLVDGPFLLAGESYGGYLARGLLASGFADRVDGLLLLCPVVVPERTAREVPANPARQYDMHFLEQLAPGDKEGFCNYAVVANAKTYGRYRAEILPGVQTGDPAFLQQLERRYAFGFDVDQRIRQTPYEKPALFLAGRQDDCVGYRDLWRLLEAYPRATFAVLDMAGHNLQVEQPELFNELIENWLLRTEER
ncbi:alpha/beta fold hydrolase [Anaeromassilibacillus senegalensis]|uniref:alpha/beta fold hydrolase n=1 Tax=Anaeromassilibacillus senegalensis TaxID=1673717 RepID=UPI000680985D|nr:alpha/beta hydrolase [Anaeromassilibacillus senegalensis]